MAPGRPPGTSAASRWAAGGSARTAAPTPNRARALGADVAAPNTVVFVDMDVVPRVGEGFVRRCGPARRGVDPGPEPDTQGRYAEYLEGVITPGGVVYVERGGVETAVNVGAKPFHEIIVEPKD